MDSRFSALLGLPRAELDHQLSPSRSAKDAAGELAWMSHATAQACASAGLIRHADRAYANHPAAKLDVFRPRAAAGRSIPCLIFLHGGFWQEGDKSVAGFAAETFADLGWATAAIGYPLTPHVSLTELVRLVHASIGHLFHEAEALGIDRSRLVIAGHSAGGHLAASLLADIFAKGAENHIAGLVLISGVYDLAPIAASYVNDLARMTATEAAALSPVRRLPRRDVPVHLLIGADEPEAFQVQTDALADHWSAGLTRLELRRVPGRDHFDILRELDDPGSPTVQAILSMD